MKYCPSCGNEMEDNAVICVKCGNVAAPAPVAAKKQPSKLWPMLVIGGVLLVAGAVFGLLSECAPYVYRFYTEFFHDYDLEILEFFTLMRNIPAIISLILEVGGKVLLLICGFDIIKNKPGILR